MAKTTNVTSSLDGLFQNAKEYLMSEKREEVLPISKLTGFRNHPFQVVEDESMRALAESIREYGIQEPLLVRKKEDGKYEIISGHRRRYAAELTGLTEVPVHIVEMDDNLATIIMVDSNIKRETLYPSEKAWAYRMRAEALRHQGRRTDLLENDGSIYTAESIGAKSGESGRTVQRYIRLTYLIPELLALVDKGKLKLMAGVALSYFSGENQDCILEFYENCGAFPSESQMRELLERTEQGEALSYETLRDVLLMREGKKRKFQLNENKIAEYFPDDATDEDIEAVILELLQNWKNNAG